MAESENDKDSIERRQDLATKVAVLEERSINNHEQFEKFEHNFLLRSKNEELLLTNLVDEVKDVDGKIDSKIKVAVDPIITKVESHEKALTRFQTIMYTLGLVLSGLFAIFEFFKEPIVKWISK